MPKVKFERVAPRVADRVRGPVAVNVRLMMLPTEMPPWMRLAQVCNSMYAAGAWDAPNAVEYLALTVEPITTGPEETHVEWHSRDYGKSS
jgi:hypothetical protein